MNERAAYVFIKRIDPDNEKHSHERILRVYDHDITLPHLLEAIEDFLRGNGYAIKLGSLTYETEE